MRRLWLVIGLVIVVAQTSSAGRPDAASEDLFEPASVLEFSLSAPFDELFAQSQHNPDYEVNGALALSGSPAIGVTVSTRGHTSRRTSECDFPKLKLTFGGAPDTSIFRGLKTLKLGTHCGDKPDAALTERFGRLANDKAPHREALVYRVLAAVGVPALRARPARIAYRWTDESAPDRSPLVRNAILLEDDDQAMKRFGGTSQIPEAKFDTAQATFSTRDTAALAFAEAMIGNFDWCLRFYRGDTYRCNNRHPLWNIHAFVRPDGSAVPAIYDFDLSGIVVGRHTWFHEVLHESFLSSGSPIEVEVLSQLQRTRSLFTRQDLDATRKTFLARKQAAYQAVANAAVDEEGRELAKSYLDAFFAVIADDARFYMPVVVDQQARAFLDAARTQPACGDHSVVPAGTPVSEPLATQGEMVQVRVLDALWEWAPPRRCDAIHQQPVWIDRTAIDTNYPR